MARRRAHTSSPYETALTQLIQRFESRTTASRQAHDAACQTIPGGTARVHGAPEPYPVRMVSASGSRLIDLDGNIYLDFFNDRGRSPCGHSPMHALDAARSQLSKGLAYGACSEPEARIATMLRDRYSAMEQVRIANSGLQATLHALLTARQARPDRPGVLVFDGADHSGLIHDGAPAGSLPAGFELFSTPFNDKDAFEATMAEQGERIGIVLINLMLNGSECLPATLAFVRLVREATQDARQILVIDEGQTACLAYGGMQSIFGIQGDLVSFGRILGAGFGLGAFGGRRDLMDVWAGADDPVPPGGTVRDDVIALAASAAALEHGLTRKALKAFNDTGDRIRLRLNTAFEKRDMPMVVTGMGSLMAIHAGRKAPLRFETSEASTALRRLFHLYMVGRDYWIGADGMVALSTEITPADADGFAEAVETFAQTFEPIIRGLAGDSQQAA